MRQRRRLTNFQYNHFGGVFTLELSHARPSKMPSPLTAQLGSTFQMWFLAMVFSSSSSEISCGVKAGREVSLGTHRHEERSGFTSCHILFIGKDKEESILHLRALQNDL